MKKIFAATLALLTIAAVGGCGQSSTPAGFDTKKGITVVSREDGSGTKSAFSELIGVEEKDSSGKKKDLTTKEAIIANKTDIMLTTVSGNPYAIGYVSMGSLNDSVKAVGVDGIAPTPENVKNGSYPVARPFFIATKGETEPLTADFIAFILSKEGQQVVSKSYIAVQDDAPAYKSSGATGKIVVVGSSSVSPVMEKLIEAYKTLNNGVEIELQASDSSAGMKDVSEGNCQIGMASRTLKDSELKELTPTQIAIDGIAVVVNNENITTGLTKAQVKSIFTGASATWADAAK